jgi:hypothetical protein
MKNLILLPLLFVFCASQAQKMTTEQHLEQLAQSYATLNNITLDSSQARIDLVWIACGMPRIRSNKGKLGLRAFALNFPLLPKVIWIEPGDLDDFVAELAHIKQFHERPGWTTRKNLAHMVKLTGYLVIHPGQGLQAAHDRWVYFDDPQDLEYNAHEVHEREIRDWLDLPQPGFYWKPK